SGHTTGATIFFGLVAYLVAREVRSWPWRVLSVVLAIVAILFIGFSRIYLEAHYLSDVLGGFGVGVVWLSGVVTGMGTLRRRREELDAAEPRPPPAVAPVPAARPARQRRRRAARQ